jgi:RND family efflux transporter MFP subunit
MSDQLTADLASLKIQRDAEPPRRGVAKVAAVVVLVGAVGTAAILFGVPALSAQIFKVEVATTEISLVSPVQASVTVTSTGYVVPQVLSKVGTKIAGRIARVEVKEGDTVKAGDVLVRLEETDQKSAIAAAGSRVAAARARADASRAQLGEIKQQSAREKTLVDKQVMGRATLDDLLAKEHSLTEAAKAADADVKAAQAEVDSLHVTLTDRTIVAPIAGTVITKPPEVGELVGPATESIVEIADFSSLVVETDVPEGRLHQVKSGGPCEVVLDAYPSRRYRGAVVELGKKVNRAKATVVVKVKFVDAAEGVLPEMSARVSFLAEELTAESMKEPPKMVVPAAAVTERAGAKVVFVIDNGKLRMIPIRVGGPFGGGFELLEGPPSGTRLVSNPEAALKDGQNIKEKTP